jgi:hypothetical protein
MSRSSEFPVLERLAYAPGMFDLFVYSCVYPASVILCLTRPEIRDHFAEYRRGFTPILGARSE